MYLWMGGEVEMGKKEGGMGGMTEYIFEDRTAEMERREECDGKDGGGGFGEMGDEALLTQKKWAFKHREDPNSESNNRDRL